MMKYTINTYDLNGKFTLMKPFSKEPLFFDSEREAEIYAENNGLDLEMISVESEEE